MTSEQICIENEKATIKKTAKLVEFIRHSQYFVAFTGPEISLAPSLDEVIEDSSDSGDSDNGNAHEIKNNISEISMPSLAHMALVKLYEDKFLKFVITLNTDGLHLKSGLPREAVAELRGNLFVEICEICGHRYERDFDVGTEGPTEERDARNYDERDTERWCEQPNCGGRLIADVVRSHNADALDASLDEARRHLQEADLCLCLGLSMATPSVSELLGIVKKRGAKLVLVTLHRTELERGADLRLHALCDDVMFLVMKALNLDIPPYIATTSDNQTIEISFDCYTFQGEAARKRFNQSDLEVDLWEGVANDANSKDFIAKKSFAKARMKAKAQWKRKWSRGPARRSTLRQGGHASDGESDSDECDDNCEKINMASSLPAKLKLLELAQNLHVDHWKHRPKRGRKPSGPDVGPVWNPNRGISPCLPVSSHNKKGNSEEDDKGTETKIESDNEFQDVETLRLEYEDPFALISSSLPANTSKSISAVTSTKRRNKKKNLETRNNNNNDWTTNEDKEVSEVDLSLL